MLNLHSGAIISEVIDTLWIPIRILQWKKWANLSVIREIIYIFRRKNVYTPDLQKGRQHKVFRKIPKKKKKLKEEEMKMVIYYEIYYKEIGN